MLMEMKFLDNMIPPLYDHQKKILEDDYLWYGNWQGTGSAKTRSCLELAEGATLVICPKQQKLDRTWETNAEKFGIIINLTVLSKEEFKKVWETLPDFDTVIIDEAHYVFGVEPRTYQKDYKKYPKTSQIFEAVYRFIQKTKPKRFYPATATPFSKPLNLWAIAKLFNRNWDYFKFREKYYIEIQRGVWIPKKSERLQLELRELLRSFGYTGSLDDFFDVPEQTHKTIHIDLSAEQKQAIKEINNSEADPLIKRGKIRCIENGILYTREITDTGPKSSKVSKKTITYKNNKIEYIKERAIEFPKLLIFAEYTAQILEIEKALKKEGYNVVTLTGNTKDRANLIKDADKADKCIVVAQASVSSGYELPSVPCVIFASKSNKFLNYNQGLGRVLRSNKLKKNLYIHLVVPGGSDEKCHESVLAGQNFIEKTNSKDELSTVE